VQIYTPPEWSCRVGDSRSYCDSDPTGNDCPACLNVARPASAPPPTSDSASPPAANPSRPSAKELSDQAEETLATIPPNDVPRLLRALESPNRYLRAGALTRLAEHAPALSREALRAVVALSNDYDRVTSGVCLQFESSRVFRGQGMMLVAAECAHGHTETVSARANAVLLRAEPSERQGFRRAYEKGCADADSVASFSFSRDDRCAKAAHDLERLGVRMRQ